MGVDEAGRDDFACAVDCLRSLVRLKGEVGSDVLNGVALYEDVGVVMGFDVVRVIMNEERSIAEELVVRVGLHDAVYASGSEEVIWRGSIAGGGAGYIPG